MIKPTLEIRSKEGTLHFRRYSLLQTPWFNIYIHRIYKEDQTPYPHNHPWNFWTWTIFGGYLEKQYQDTTYQYTEHKTFSLMKHSCKEYHKIVHLYKKPTTTLVVTGKRINPDWGYLINGKEVSFQEYRKQ